MTIIKKIKPLKSPVSITANKLLKGLSVYLKKDGSWSNDISDSAIAYSKEEENKLLQLADITIKSQYVLGAYSFPINIKNGKATPNSIREKIRANKIPTVEPTGLTKKYNWQNEFTKTNKY